MKLPGKEKLNAEHSIILNGSGQGLKNILNPGQAKIRQRIFKEYQDIPGLGYALKLRV